MALKKLDCGFLCANGVSNRHLKQPANSHQGNGIMRAEGISYFFLKKTIYPLSPVIASVISFPLSLQILCSTNAEQQGREISLGELGQALVSQLIYPT